MKDNTWLIITILFLILGATGAYIGYKMAYAKIDRDKESLKTKVDLLFRGKHVIGDGQKTTQHGEFTDKDKMHYQVLYGGFVVYELSKESGGYLKSKISSGDLYYKNPETEWVPARYIEDRFGKRKITSGHSRKTFRFSVQHCFDEAYEYLLKGNVNDRRESYTPNTLNEIRNFPSGFNNEYYYIEKTNFPSTPYISKSGSGRVYAANHEVIYFKDMTFYKLASKDDEIQKAILIHIGIGSGAGFVLTFILAFILNSFKRKAGKSNLLLKTQWKNIEESFILTIESKTFGNHIASLVDNNQLTKGSAKFTENGNNLQLTFGDKEFYYQILKSEPNKLELKNLTTDAISKFEKLGSNAYAIDIDNEKQDDSAQDTRT